MSEPQDADLRARLRAADPAAGLPGAEASDVDHLLGRVVHSDLRETGTRRRNRLTWLVAAAAVVVIAFGVAWWIGDEDAKPGVIAKPGAGGSARPANRTELTAGPVTARCVTPTAQLLAAKPIAFSGRVLGIADGVVTIRTATVYAGNVSDRVTVQAAIAPDGGTIEGDPEFQAGQDYLVAADGGRVVGCGMSGPATSELAGLYAQAFPR